MKRSHRVTVVNAQRIPKSVLVIACGALAREINALKQSNDWRHLYVQYMSAGLHNQPILIPETLRARIRENNGKYDHIFVAYADCGTGGGIDQVLEEEGIKRLPGAHCYQFFAGFYRFAKLSAAEPGTFYVTDFLVRNFQRLVIKPLQLDEHPELYQVYFGNYRRLLFLSQTHDAALLQAARDSADRLALEFEHVHCGYGDLQTSLREQLDGSDVGQQSAHLIRNRGLAGE